ncbi:VOC family protein [Aliicoccus persicus]|uniref:VOC domain-containing protein n=1 Tax=Aliicoccus persicus TaxID=930138 RepID=A0A662Z4U9_9STAP|nr:VOC family protein [Aliicoccus persicus]SEW14506.1 hypothetical protein SAMN05192557_1807 [Aliicoccus persicus]
MNRINLIALGIHDMEASYRFYKDVLGFETFEVNPNAPIVFFNNRGTKLELFPIEALAKDVNADDPPEIKTGGFNGITLAYNAKTEDEVDAIFEHLIANDVEIVKMPERVFWGGYSGYFKDPNGYYWEVAKAAFEFDDQDMIIIENDSQS